ncbi:DUF1009 domain-containing protein [Roseobacter denitrificans]|uniref:Phosphatidate cytidyltransferase n=1 Tax=Roseobacter denitrificans (strain ATCC 33942 / OCh 114) TaxID=375451 RepID=Q166E5_ROSDO|nr:UDP-2,3-diacylglucosamine diphosphatase LpxI [Roseobacter denitrificans]ABG32148.1 conserved hypothetical protein [Roseobacter denitrificans OCh 114]AVL51653.1 DUF1009 domain-containing protein [Roseobacter denitrificans]SFF77978.1 hypothetical protein SAMN05443635_102109 [Roseobacter denitrificans OCh 114]
MLALITGRGGLPARVAAAQTARPLVCVLEGFAPEGLDADITFRLEHLGSFIAQLKERGVTSVCFCGAIERPPFDPAALDGATVPLVPTLMQAMGAGDDAALRAVMALFEQQGFEIAAAHVLAPDILAPEGVLSEAQPDTQMQADIARADDVLQALSPVDVGQGCVVGQGLVWGIETIGGTDHLLATLPTAVRRARAVLVKAPKTGQDMRADLPAIGPDTVEAAGAAGLAGIVIQAGAMILLDPEATIAGANKTGLVLWSRASA